MLVSVSIRSLHTISFIIFGVSGGRKRDGDTTIRRIFSAGAQRSSSKWWLIQHWFITIWLEGCRVMIQWPLRMTNTCLWKKIFGVFEPQSAEEPTAVLYYVGNKPMEKYVKSKLRMTPSVLIIEVYRHAALAYIYNPIKKRYWHAGSVMLETKWIFRLDLIFFPSTVSSWFPAQQLPVKNFLVLSNIAQLSFGSFWSCFSKARKLLSWWGFLFLI